MDIKHQVLHIIDNHPEGSMIVNYARPRFGGTEYRTVKARVKNLVCKEDGLSLDEYPDLLILWGNIKNIKVEYESKNKQL